jgi:hypothetical protein
MSLKNNKPIIFTTELYWTGDKVGIVGSASLKSLPYPHHRNLAVLRVNGVLSIYC